MLKITLLGTVLFSLSPRPYNTDNFWVTMQRCIAVFSLFAAPFTRVGGNVGYDFSSVNNEIMGGY